MKINNVRDMLKYIEKNGVEYTVLRGYIPIEEIDSSKDVDIYIPHKYKKKVHRLFIDQGWYCQKINCSRFPHKQYIYIMSDGIKKIDIVYGLYYSNKLFKYQKEDNILNDIRKIEDINVLDPLNGLTTFILHLCFDKYEVSEKNFKYLKLMYEDYLQNSDKNFDNLFVNYAKEIINDEYNLKQYRKDIRKSGLISYNPFRHIYHRIYTKLNNMLRMLLLKLNKKSIAIIGVDGSGKSTATNLLNNILDDKCLVKYMGFKNYEINFVSKHFENEKSTAIYKINSLIFQWLDIWKRYFETRYLDKFIIFDRYPWEAAINYHGLSKIICYIQYLVFFPKPKKVYYLYCSYETSINRKDDIEDKEKFKQMKEKFDKEYLNNKKIKSFSTDDYSTTDIINFIIDDLNEQYLKYFI